MRPPNIRASVEPADRMTAVGGDPIYVVLGLGSLRVSEDDVASLVPRIALRAEGGRTVACRVTALHTSFGGDDYRRYIELSPEVPLRPEWYEVVIDLRELALDPSPELVPDIVEGVYVSRFYPDSFPVLRAVRVFFTEDKGAIAQIVFSEPVDYFPDNESAGDSPFVMLLDDVPCKLLPNLEVADGAFAESFSFQCADVSMASVLTLSMERTLASEAGTTARLHSTEVGQTTIEFAFSESYECGGCSAFHMP